MDVRNNLKDKEARFEWIENGKKKSITVPANDRGVAKVIYSFQPITFRAFAVSNSKDKSVGQPQRLVINGQDQFVLKSQNVGKNRIFVHVDAGKFVVFIKTSVRLGLYNT